jgi:outer membrane murein-binding lipoprotein Lpp
MNLKKRAIPILILALMFLSMVPLLPVKAQLAGSRTPAFGVYETLVTVTGSGVTVDAVIQVGWDGLKAWDGVKGLVNSTEAEGDGTFEVTFEVPESVNGLHYIWIKDTDTGETLLVGDFDVDAMIEFDPSSGLNDDEITVNGYGFGEEEEIADLVWDYGDTYNEQNLTMSPSTPDTDEVGSWSASFDVPSLDPHDDYLCRVWQDGWTVWADEIFTIGASIDTNVDEGPVGMEIEVSGRGFLNGLDVDTGAITYDGVVCYVTNDDTTSGDGEFDIECIIPGVSDTGEFDLEVTLGLVTVSKTFECTGLAEIEIDPEFGVQGASVEITGVNFTQLSEDVVLELWEGVPPTTKVQDIGDPLDTTVIGEFEGTFIVPARTSGLYTIRATQDDYNIAATTSFRIGMMIVLPTPKSGPCGTEVTLSGTGFTEFGEWNATLGDILVAEGDVDAGSNLEMGAGLIPTFFIPTMDPGTYPLTVMDIDTEISVDSEFTVTDRTYLTTDPLVAPNEWNVTIEGYYFAAEEGWDIDFVLYNVTEDGEIDMDWSITVRQDGSTDVETSVDEDDDFGYFEAWWIVPEKDDISLGEYWLNATDDANDLWAQYMFEIVDKTVDIEPRKPSFANGETVAFNIMVSFPFADSYIEIYDPDGELYWQTDLFSADEWIKVDVISVVPFYQQVAGGNPMVLMDAPTGTWSWTWFDFEDEEVDSGTFTVTEAPEDILAGRIDELGDSLSGLTEDFTGLADDVTDLSGNLNTLSGELSTLASGVSSLAGDVADLAGDVSAAIQAANTASSKVDDLAETVADIAEVASNAATAAQNAAQAATAAQTAAENAGQQTSGLTTLVYGAIGAALVAALAAIVSLMQISRRIAG